MIRRTQKLPKRAFIFADDPPDVFRAKRYINRIIQLRREAWKHER